MREKKDVLTVTEAKQRLRDSAATIQPKQFLHKNFWQVTLASFIVGMLSADSVKTRESIVSLAATAMKKML